MQDNFDPNLVRLFDKQGWAGVGSFDVASGASVSAVIGQGTGLANQANLTSPFGMADFGDAAVEREQKDVTTTVTGGEIDLARAVAVAETAGAADGQDAIVRVRQNGQDQLAVSFYKSRRLLREDRQPQCRRRGLRPGGSRVRAYGLQSGGTLCCWARATASSRRRRSPTSTMATSSP